MTSIVDKPFSFVNLHSPGLEVHNFAYLGMIDFDCIDNVSIIIMVHMMATCSILKNYAIYFWGVILYVILSLVLYFSSDNLGPT